MKKIIYSFAVLMLGLSLTACSSDDDSNSSSQSDAKYSDKSYGIAAIEACATTVTELEKANSVIGKASLTSEQETYLRNTLYNIVSNVIVPTYTNLANQAELLEKTLNGLTSSTITQSQINTACNQFKEARAYWEKSEAFLGGAASDFDVDPTIDSWPLNRSLLLNYFNNGMSSEMLDDATILGFHALEFILFRDGQPRKVAELQGYDTYKNFEKITGAQELKYAQEICTLLKERTFQLQVAWEGETTANASRVSAVKAAGLDYMTENGLSYGENLTTAGLLGSKSTFSTLKAAIAQVLSDDEGSCVAICNEVGTAKIANPFAAGDISYVESPYSYNSIVDFQNNIRSIQNVWFGNTNGTVSNGNSFHNFFEATSQSSVNTAVENAVSSTITKIGAMPAPFVKYCSIVWGKAFEDDNEWD